MTEEEFIDVSAMLNLMAIIFRGNILSNHHEDAMEAYSRAKKLWEYRCIKDEDGIVAIKKRRRKVEE